MEETRRTLGSLMRNVATDIIIGMAKVDNNESAYWDEFLGDYANVTRGNDRVFSTAVTLNALIGVEYLINFTNTEC